MRRRLPFRESNHFFPRICVDTGLLPDLCSTAAGLSAKTSFLDGLVLGFACIASIGLQNLFVFNSVLAQTRSRVPLTTEVVIVFDVSFALACFFGVGAVIDLYEWLEAVIAFAGSLIVICIRVKFIEPSWRKSVLPARGTPFLRSSHRPAW